MRNGDAGEKVPGFGGLQVEQIGLFSIPDGAWATPGNSPEDASPGADSGECEFGESALNECVVRAAGLRHDFGQFQMEQTIPSMFPAGSCSRWPVQSPGAKKNAVRMQYLSIYAYLASRAKLRPELLAEVSEIRALIGTGFDEFLRECAPEILL
jgi:hypothetical protein